MIEDVWTSLPDDARECLHKAGINDLVTLCSLNRDQAISALGNSTSYYRVRDRLREHGLLMRKEPTPPHVEARLASFAALFEAGLSIKEIAEKEGYSRSTAYAREAELSRERARMKIFRRWESQMSSMRNQQK